MIRIDDNSRHGSLERSLERIRLTEWARREGIARITAYRMLRRGILPVVSERSPTGRWYVYVRVESGRTHCHLRPRRTGAGSDRNSQAAGRIAIEVGAAQESVGLHRGSRESRIRSRTIFPSSRHSSPTPHVHRDRHRPSVGRRRVPVPVPGGGSRIAGPLVVRGRAEQGIGVKTRRSTSRARLSGCACTFTEGSLDWRRPDTQSRLPDASRTQTSPGQDPALSGVPAR